MTERRMTSLSAIENHLNDGWPHGPWKVVERRNNWSTCDVANCFDSAFAILPKSGSGHLDAMMATLVAAAPEMLEALQKSGDPASREVAARIMESIRALEAKLEAGDWP